MRGVTPVAGVDEAGRGPLAGPVVAACVVLDPRAGLPGVADSKLLSPSRREALYELIVRESLDWSVAEVSATVIDRINILRATGRAMRLAAEGLATRPAHLLVDGLPVAGLPFEQTAIVKGDRRCQSIAAASIVAKVTRDRIMTRLAERYPAYGFERHKGYPTVAHREAIRLHGATPEHRVSFALLGRVEPVPVSANDWASEDKPCGDPPAPSAQPAGREGGGRHE
jgi:ribonuclease HII